MYRIAHGLYGRRTPQWGCLRNGVLYTGIAHTRNQELKRALQDETSTINREMLRRMFDSFVYRLRQCNANEGGRL